MTTFTEKSPFFDSNKIMEKLLQLEYLDISTGAPSVGIVARDGLVLVTDSTKLDRYTMCTDLKNNIEIVPGKIGLVYSGLSPDYCLIVKYARETAQEYLIENNETISALNLMREISIYLQNYTDSSKRRPVCLTLLVCGWENDEPQLYQCNPFGQFFSNKTAVLGKLTQEARKYLNESYNEDICVNDAIRIGLQTLKLNHNNSLEPCKTEVAVYNKNGFERIEKPVLQEYLLKKIY